MGLTSRFATFLDCVTLYFSYFESQAGSFCLSPRKAQGPKGLSQKVRDTAVIHNQASLRPCIQQRGITPVLSTGVNAAVLFTKKNTACTSIPIGMAKMVHQTVSFWHYCYIPISIHFQVSQLGFFTLMYPSASTLTRKSGFMLLIKQSANCLPISIHSISSPAGR